MSARSSLLLLALLVVTACGGAGGSGSVGWAGTVTDSAGVSIVHNPERGTWGPGQAWTVREDVTVGETADDPHYQFGQIIGADVDDAGNIYVADVQGRDVRVYDPSGKYLRTIGGPGAGPGEFGMGMGGLEVIGDVLWVPDLGNQRLSKFSLEGEPQGDTHVDFAQALPIRWGELPAGRLVAQLRHLAFTGPDTGPRGDAIVAVNADGTFGDTVDMLPAGEALTISGGRAQTRLFGAEPMWASGPDGELVSGKTSEFRLDVRDADGTLKRIVTRTEAPKPVTDRDKRVVLDFLRKRAQDQGQVPADVVEAYLKTIQFADNYPAFAGLIVGPQGTIWAQRVRTGEELAGSKEGTFDIQDLGSPDWDVFDGEGKYLGVVTFPERYQPIRVVGDRFLGVARNDLDVQMLKVYRVVTG